MKPEDYLKFQLRTLEIVLKEDVQYNGKDYFKDLYFIPNNLTTVSFSDVDLSTSFLGKKVQYPICAASLSGGSKKITKINEKIGEFCNKFKIAQGIGDQIHYVHNPDEVSDDVAKSYSITREKNPKGIILANLSARYISQSKNYIKRVKDAINIIKADGIEIYVEPLLDIMWDHKSSGTVGLIKRLEDIVNSIETPVIVKSICTGLTNEDVRTLWDIGISAINIEGVGGTSFSRIETLKKLTFSEKQSVPAIKNPFDFWGIPTIWSLLDMSLRRENQNIPLILGGGIRTGRQAIKALAMGADLVSIGYPLLIQLMEDFGYPDENNLETWFENLIYEMKMMMVLLGVKNIKELREIVRTRVIIKGRTNEWIKGRNLNFPPKFVRKQIVR